MSEDLIVGRGEVGSALLEVIPDAESYDLVDGPYNPASKRQFQRVHIAVPWSDGFHAVVGAYRNVQPDALIIVYSTVPIGTCESLGVVHSPIVGPHPRLAEAIRFTNRWYGTSDSGQAMAFFKFWMGLGIGTLWLRSANHTEFLKLRSTARYGINLAFAEYEHRVAEDLYIEDFTLRYWDRDYNELYEKMGIDGAKRYVLTDPKGTIGGHCVVPNAKLLNEQYPHPMLDEIIEMEEKK